MKGIEISSSRDLNALDILPQGAGTSIFFKRLLNSRSTIPIKLYRVWCFFQRWTASMTQASMQRGPEAL